MKKAFLILILALSPLVAYGAQFNCTLTLTAGTSVNWSTATWGACNSTYPGDPASTGNIFTAKVTLPTTASATSLVIDKTVTLQTTAINFPALWITASAPTSATVTGPQLGTGHDTTGETLTLIGFNNTNSYIMQLDRYAHFAPNGLTIQGDQNAVDTALHSTFVINGILDANGLADGVTLNQGTWSSGTTYALNDVVKRSVYTQRGPDHFIHYYKSLQASNTNNSPESSPTFWVRVDTFWTNNPSASGCGGGGCVNWNNTATALVTTWPINIGPLDSGSPALTFPLLEAALIGNGQPIANAAGTGLGKYGDTSLALTQGAGTCGAGSLFHTEQPNIASISSAGDYWVDYTGSMVVYKTATQGCSVNMSATYKYLSFIGYQITINSANTYNQAIFDHNSFMFVGTHINPFIALLVGNKTTTGTFQTFQFTNNSMMFCVAMIYSGSTSGAGNQSLTGTSGSPVLVNSNSIVGQASSFYSVRSQNSYVQIENNYFSAGNSNMFVTNSSTDGTVYSFTNSVLSHNFQNGNMGVAVGPSGASTVGSSSFAATEISDNWRTQYAWASGAGDRGWQSLNSLDPANPLRIHDNTAMNPYRGVLLGGGTKFYNNIIWGSPHHSIATAPGNSADASILNFFLALPSEVSNNLVLQATGFGSFQTSYVGDQILDSWSSHNNVFNYYPQGGVIAMEIGDCGDCQTINLLTNFSLYNNMASNVGYAYQRKNTSYTSAAVRNFTVLHTSRMDWNAPSSVSNAFYFTPGIFGQVGTFYKGTGVEYNMGPVNITGLSLNNPSYTSNTTGHTVVWSYTGTSTAPTAITLALDTGAAVNMIWCSGSVTTASTNLGLFNTASKIIDSTDCGKGGGWSQDPTNANAPMGKWIEMTSGTQAGNVRRIVDFQTATAHTLNVVPAWTAFGAQPQIGDTYVIILAETSLSDGSTACSGSACTLLADTLLMNSSTGAFYMPTSTQTDSSISMNFQNIGGVNSTTGIPPNYRGVACNPMKWSAAYGGSANIDSINDLMSANTGPDSTVGITNVSNASLIAYFQYCFTAMNGQLAGSGPGGTSPGYMVFNAASF